MIPYRRLQWIVTHRLMIFLPLLVVLPIFGWLLLFTFGTFPALSAPLQPPADESLERQPVADSYVVSARPDEAQPADLRVVWIGHNNLDGYGTERALFQFDLADLPVGRTVVSAQFSLYLARTAPANAAPMAARVTRLDGDWTETITWNQHTELLHNSAHAVTTEVGAAEQWYSWELRDLVQSWLDDPARELHLSLLLTGNESSVHHERAFWSKDCNPADCAQQPGQRPKLVIQLAPISPTMTPTSLPTPSPTPTATPTAFPTPTPGLEYIRLSSMPRTQILPGNAVTYTLEYKNGPHTLTDLQIISPIPERLVLQPEYWPLDYLPPVHGMTISVTETTSGNVITWDLQEDVAPLQTDKLVYRLWRPISSRTTTGLTITKHGPAQVELHDLIHYDLIVTNHTTATLSNIVITDTLPTHVHYIAGGVRLGDTLHWYVPTLSAGAAITSSYVVTADQTIIDCDYGVRTGGGLVTHSDVPVKTIVGETAAPQPDCDGPIVHSGGYTTWRDANGITTMPINSVQNPSFVLFLPLIH